ncbi:hypothetical protein L6452_13759 [Arctium lappa]|uniref:Uncharacterized protein n=1 Tax=Arctium lappa TaxID=4217 RepID=A0ACB9CJ12_ARCLA|nr:hypothetical protein L6452_13759 [Arctium lappa]
MRPSQSLLSSISKARFLQSGSCKVKRISPNDPYASKKLMECEKAVIKLKFKEAIAIPTTERCSISESIDFHTIGLCPDFSSDMVLMRIRRMSDYIISNNVGPTDAFFLFS